MIISPKIKNENDNYKIFEAVKIAFAKLNSNIKHANKGRPRKYSDEQIVACMLYGVKHSIFSLRELEYKIKKDYVFQAIVNLKQIPDYSIFSLTFDLTTANVYDNQVPDLLYEAKIYNPFLILADAAYDLAEWFEIATKLEFNLLTDINMRKSKSIESFVDKRYENALFFQSPIGVNLYKNRLKIEQLFSVLKGLYNLENPRLYRQARYERQIKWVLLAYLIDEFNKKQQGIKSRKYPWNL